MKIIRLHEDYSMFVCKGLGRYALEMYYMKGNNLKTTAIFLTKTAREGPVSMIPELFILYV